MYPTIISYGTCLAVHVHVYVHSRTAAVLFQQGRSFKKNNCSPIEIQFESQSLGPGPLPLDPSLGPTLGSRIISYDSLTDTILILHM